MKIVNYRNIPFLLWACLLFLSGCTTFNAFPVAARAGDTVTLAVGSPLDMSRANTTAIFTSDSDGIPIDITSNIRAIFKLYGDKASSIYEAGAAMQNIVSTSGHEPWITVVALDLPAGLPLGPSQIDFTTMASYPTIGSHINDFPVSLEIISGVGTPADFAYEFGLGSMLTGDLTDLEPQPRAELGPAFPSIACPCPDYGAIEVKLTLATSFGVTLPLAFVRVLADDMTVETGSGRSLVYGLNNGEDLTVMFLSPTGKLKYYEARFAVVLHSAVDFTATPTINSVRYFALDGSEIIGPVVDYNIALKN